MQSEQLPLSVAAVLADPNTLIARDHALTLADADPAILRALADPSADLSVPEALKVADPDDRLELCPKGCGEAVYPRGLVTHLPKCNAVDSDPFPDADSTGVRAR